MNLTHQLAIVVFCALLSPPLTAGELIKLESRPGVTTSLFIDESKEPTAVLLLVEGGTLQVNLGTFFGKPTFGNPYGFLTRSRGEFTKRGLTVALIDRPSDMPEVRHQHRVSTEHAADLKAVVDFLRTKYKLPLWLVGMSAGALSIGNFAQAHPTESDGLIFVSPVTKPRKIILDRFPDGAASFDYSNVAAPAMVLVHKRDQCSLTPPAGADLIKDRIRNTDKVAVVALEGGRAPVSEACKARSEHGFWGIEDKGLDAIADFIRTNRSSEPASAGAEAPAVDG
jgi:pimeloyl-ACP methyl ester carboxylesterase